MLYSVLESYSAHAHGFQDINDLDWTKSGQRLSETDLMMRERSKQRSDSELPLRQRVVAGTQILRQPVRERSLMSAYWEPAKSVRKQTWITE